MTFTLSTQLFLQKSYVSRLTVYLNTPLECHQIPDMWKYNLNTPKHLIDVIIHLQVLGYTGVSLNTFKWEYAHLIFNSADCT